MAKGYASIGHGRTPSGGYDPGTQGFGGVEHEEARRVVREVSRVLDRLGVSHVAEDCPDGRNSHAPNWAGSYVRANRGGVEVAVEVHFDWRKAPRGGFGIYASSAGKRVAKAIAKRYKELGLPRRGHQHRPGLGFVRNTTMPAILWECDRIGVYSAERVREIGEAIGHGIADYLGVGSDEEIVGQDEEEEQVLKKGDEGTGVRVMQEALKGWRGGALPEYGADGDFGSETEEWVKRYQDALGIRQTGVIDGLTAAFLSRYVSKSGGDGGNSGVSDSQARKIARDEIGKARVDISPR